MKFRKKPVEIDAVQYSEISQDEIEGLCQAAHDGVKGKAHIHTLEGIMEVSHLDWIIKGVKGEFYPCKPDIFDMTYEEVR